MPDMPDDDFAELALLTEEESRALVAALMAQARADYDIAQRIAERLRALEGNQ